MAKVTKTKTSLSGSGTKYESIKDAGPKYVPIEDYKGGKKTKTRTVNPDTLESIKYAPGNKTRVKTPRNPSTVGVGSATRTRKRFE